jgi:hypothetical protein
MNGASPASPTGPVARAISASTASAAGMLTSAARRRPRTASHWMRGRVGHSPRTSRAMRIGARNSDPDLTTIPASVSSARPARTSRVDSPLRPERAPSSAGSSTSETGRAPTLRSVRARRPARPSRSPVCCPDCDSPTTSFQQRSVGRYSTLDASVLLTVGLRRPAYTKRPNSAR